MIDLLISLGYAGAFIAGLLSSISIFLPSPSFIIVFILGGYLNPFFIGLLAGIGAGLGELTGYYLGRGGEKYLFKKSGRITRLLKKFEFYFTKYNSNAVIFFMALTPLPFDFIGILCGSIKYPVKQFLAATMFGKVLKYMFIAYAGYYSLTWIVSYF